MEILARIIFDILISAEFAVTLICTAAGVLCGGAIGLLCVRKFRDKETGRMSAGGAALSWLAAFMGWQLAAVLCRCLAYIIMGFADPGPLFADGNAAERVLLYGAASLPVSLLYSLISLPVLIVLLPAAKWAYSEMKIKTAEKKKGTARAWTAVFYAAFTAVSAMVIAVAERGLMRLFPPDGTDYLEKLPDYFWEYLDSMASLNFVSIILSAAAGLLCGGAAGLRCVRKFRDRETGRLPVRGALISWAAAIGAWSAAGLLSRLLILFVMSLAKGSFRLFDVYDVKILMFYGMGGFLALLVVVPAAWWLWKMTERKSGKKEIRAVWQAACFVLVTAVYAAVSNAAEICMFRIFPFG